MPGVRKKSDGGSGDLERVMGLRNTEKQRGPGTPGAERQLPGSDPRNPDLASYEQ